MRLFLLRLNMENGTRKYRKKDLKLKNVSVLFNRIRRCERWMREECRNGRLCSPLRSCPTSPDIAKLFSVQCRHLDARTWTPNLTYRTRIWVELGETEHPRETPSSRKTVHRASVCWRYHPVRDIRARNLCGNRYSDQMTSFFNFPAPLTPATRISLPVSLYAGLHLRATNEWWNECFQKPNEFPIRITQCASALW